MLLRLKDTDFALDLVNGLAGKVGKNKYLNPGIKLALKGIIFTKPQTLYLEMLVCKA